MNVGERVKFQFGGKEKEGWVVKIFPKRVYLRVDFPRHPGKNRGKAHRGAGREKARHRRKKRKRKRKKRKELSGKKRRRKRRKKPRRRKSRPE